MKTASLAAIAAVSLALAGPALAAAPLNAGFETGDLTSWTSSGQVEVLQTTPDYYQVFDFSAPEGMSFAQLTAGAASVYTTLSQSFTVDEGSTLSFQAAFLAFDDAGGNDDAYVRVFSTTSDKYVFQIAIDDIEDYGVSDWARYSTGLTAGEYTIEAAVANNVDATRSSKLLFDNVQVAPVPEPATWAMMIAGFGLMGGAMRRRRALAAA